MFIFNGGHFVRATLPPSMLIADCAEPYRNIPSMLKAKDGLLYLLSSWAYTGCEVAGLT